nr:ribonuclease H-like domain-containing protein [Tanacetum cinerariifolium]
MFNFNVGNMNNAQRSQTYNSNSRPSKNRPSSNRNRRPNGGSSLLCEHCGFNGHTIDKCFKLIGYPADFKKRNNNSNNNQGVQNFNKRFINNNNSVGSSSTSFYDDQISKLIALIKENSMFKWQRCTCQYGMYYSKQKGITLSHPNGTEACITKVGNMVLNENLTLYDVLVVPEYYVSLMSIHKVVRDNKLIVAFDESKCYVLPQDLRDMKVLRIGNQKDGLYYFNEKQ